MEITCLLVGVMFAYSEEATKESVKAVSSLCTYDHLRTFLLVMCSKRSWLFTQIGKVQNVIMPTKFLYEHDKIFHLIV